MFITITLEKASILADKIEEKLSSSPIGDAYWGQTFVDSVRYADKLGAISMSIPLGNYFKQWMKIIEEDI